MANKYDEKKEEQKLNGVDEATQEKMNSSFVQSDAVTEADATSNKALSNLGSLTSKSNIISNSTKNALNKKFVVPSAVKEADVWLSSQLETIQSGKTSYSDQVRDMMEQIKNRDKFSYDVDTDPLFQQALASAMNSGKQAMQDTIGQASALTGGYGSTYATSAGNQAYNAFIEDAYNNLPQYYQMAMNAYQMEGDEMYRMLGMYTDADDREYNRNVTAYDATYQHRNQMYNEAYTQYRDTKSDAHAMANLELNEHGQRVSDAYNYYNATSNNANTLYDREYTNWADEVNQATQYAQMQNNDYWNQTNFDEGVREYEKSFAEQQRQYNESLAEQKRQHNEQMSYNWETLNRKNSGGDGDGNDLKIPSDISSKASKFKTDAERADYLDGLVESGYISQEQADYLYETNMLNSQKPYEERTWTMSSKGGLNWGLGIDKNGKVEDEYGNEYTLGQLWDEMSKTMGEDEAETWIKKLQKDLGITWW